MKLKLKKTRKKAVKFIRKNFTKKSKAIIYTRYYKHCKVKKNTILYQAYSSKILAGNPYAMFKYLINNPKYKHLKHIWIVKDKNAKHILPYKNNKNVEFVIGGSKKHMKYLATAEYLVNNAAFPSYYIKKKEQVYINTWHGTPLKGLGKYDKSLNRRPIMSAQRNFLCCDYLVMPNKYTTDILMEHYDVKNIFKGEIVEEGYPRIDLVLNTEKEKIIKELEEKIGYSLQDKKIILYAPTFRSENISNAKKHIDNSNQICEYIEQIMEKMPKNYVMFFKAHSNLLGYFKDNEKITKMFLFDDFETNEILSITDVLMTDYSSVFFDYLCTKRPIIFFTYDREKYERERGFLFPLDELPGKLCDTVEDVIGCLNDINNSNYNYSEKYKNFIEKFAYLDDGQATKRVVDAIFHNQKSKNTYKLKEEKKNILAYVGKLGEGAKAKAVLKFLKSIDYGKNNVILFGNYSKRETSIFQCINKDISFVTYMPPKSYTVCEKFKRILFGYKAINIYDREYVRNLGHCKFDEIINFNPKKIVFKMMLETSENAKKSIYLTKKKYNQENIEILIKEGYSKIIINEEEIEESLCSEKIETINMNDQNNDIYGDLNIPLNILFIAGFDSTNYIYLNLFKQLEKRGHRYTIVVKDIEDEVNNRMFEDNPNIVSIKDFKYKTLDEYDFVVSTPIKHKPFDKLYKEIYANNMFVYTFSTLFSSITMRVLGDIVLTIGENKFKEFEENYLKYNMIAVGNPQYDKLIENKKETISNEKIKKILFVEQGAYPCGEIGKQQLADTLINIAENNKDKEIYIKPRYLPSEVSKTIHTVSEHIYDFLENVPENLKLIQEPTVLEEILPEFDAMITMWSTAYIEAIALNMPLILIEGFDSKDVFDIRENRVQAAYDVLRNTGCVVNFKDLYNKKLEFKYVNEEFQQKEIYNYNHECSSEIVDLFELIDKKLILTNKRFKGFFQKTLKEFYNSLGEMKLFDKQEKEYKNWKKNYNKFNTFMQELVYINRCMGNKLDLTECVDLIEKKHQLMNKKDISDKLKERKEEIEFEFFADEDNNVNENKILQDFYFDWLFRNKKYGTILKYDYDSIKSKESYEYYLARIYLKKGNLDRSFNHISNFLNIVADKKGSTELLKEKRLREYLKPFIIKSRRYKLIRYLYKNNYYNEILLLDFPSLRKDLLILYYKIKVLNKMGLYSEIVSLYEKFKNSTVSKKRNIKVFIKKVFANIVEKQYNYARKIEKEM